MVRGLHRRFRGKVALHDLSLRVCEGEIVGLLGPNGAGKSTAFKIISGQLPAHDGDVSLKGEMLGRQTLWQRARRGLGYCPQGPSLVGRLTVLENICLGLGKVPVQARRKRALILLDAFGGVELAHCSASVLSGGERRQVELIRAFAAQPSVLLVDEPFAGLDPLAVEKVTDSLRLMASRGVGVLFTDHDVRQSLALCHRVYILKDGKRLCTGRPAEVIKDPIARAEYFGEGVGVPSSLLFGGEFRPVATPRLQKKAE